MLRVSLWLHLSVSVLGFALGSINCPDGSVCSNLATCCQTEKGYECCPYPNVSQVYSNAFLHDLSFPTLEAGCSDSDSQAVCCADLENCCPPGYTCDLVVKLCVKQNQPWMNVPMVRKEAPHTPELSVSPIQELKSDDKTTIVHCDSYYACPDGTTCCHHPKGGWFCCPYSPVSRKCF